MLLGSWRVVLVGGVDGWCWWAVLVGGVGGITKGKIISFPEGDIKFSSLEEQPNL